MAEVLPDLSLTEWAVLGVIAEHDTHGFSVARLFEPTGSVGRVWTVPRPLVYRAIDALVERGLVQRIGSAPGAGGPRRTVLRVAELG
jgi:DNA-binding PadR family transcriptional regulator